MLTIFQCEHFCKRDYPTLAEHLRLVLQEGKDCGLVIARSLHTLPPEVSVKTKFELFKLMLSLFPSYSSRFQVPGVLFQSHDVSR